MTSTMLNGQFSLLLQRCRPVVQPIIILKKCLMLFNRLHKTGAGRQKRGVGNHGNTNSNSSSPRSGHVMSDSQSDSESSTNSNHHRQQQQQHHHYFHDIHYQYFKNTFALGFAQGQLSPFVSSGGARLDANGHYLYVNQASVCFESIDFIHVIYLFNYLLISAFYVIINYSSVVSSFCVYDKRKENIYLQFTLIQRDF